MKPLCDGDIICYSLGACGQFIGDDGEVQVRSFDYVMSLITDKIDEICRCVDADEPPTLFLTGDQTLIKSINRVRKFRGEELLKHKDNFRMSVATIKPYKGTRKAEKPLYYHAIRSYLWDHYDCIVANGCEADDLMASLQTDDTIICTLDKDLRQVPGWHYAWQRGEIAAKPPELVTKEGYLEMQGKKLSLIHI